MFPIVPPDAATSDIEAFTGFTPGVSRISRQITSEATAAPPGLSTRSTFALMELSARNLRRYSTIVSDPIPVPAASRSWRIGGLVN